VTALGILLALVGIAAMGCLVAVAAERSQRRWERGQR
jgi:hypothetical protein